MPLGTEPGEAALFATVGANSDGLVVIVVRITGGFESRPRQIHATTTSDAKGMNARPGNKNGPYPIRAVLAVVGLVLLVLIILYVTLV
jgi:hypothetical protein